MWSAVIVAGLIIMIVSYQCIANQTETIPNEPITGQDPAVYPPNPSRGESEDEEEEEEEEVVDEEDSDDDIGGNRMEIEKEN